MSKLVLALFLLVSGCGGVPTPPYSQYSEPSILEAAFLEDRFESENTGRFNIQEEVEQVAPQLRDENYPRIFPYLCDTSDNGDTLTVAFVCENLYMAWSMSCKFSFTDDIASYIPNSFYIASGCFSSPFDGGWDEWCNITNESQECWFCEPRCHMGPFRPLIGFRDEINIPIYRHYEDWEPTRVCDRMQPIGAGPYTMGSAKFLKKKAGTFKVVVTRFVLTGDDAPGGEECRTTWYNNYDNPGDSLEVRLFDRDEGALE